MAVTLPGAGRGRQPDGLGLRRMAGPRSAAFRMSGTVWPIPVRLSPLTWTLLPWPTPATRGPSCRRRVRRRARAGPFESAPEIL